MARERLVCGWALAAVNLKTGAPLLAIWTGSRLAVGGASTPLAVLAGLAVLAATVSGLAWLRAVLGARLGLAEHEGWRDLSLVTRERAAVVAVVVAVLAAEIWLCFFSGVPIAGHPGR